jgi:hypothetical protein
LNFFSIRNAEVVEHLKKVYSLLTLTVACASAGAFFVLKTGWTGNFVTFIGQIALIIWLAMTPTEVCLNFFIVFFFL